MIHRSCCRLNLVARLTAVAAMSILACIALAESTIDAGNRHNWGANIGWIDWRAQLVSGAVFTPKVASGYIWSANIGWIGLGDGTPANGTAYANNSVSDYGVNVDANSDVANFLLSGYAWAANAGWISFNITDPLYRPRVQKGSGVLKGYAWGANIGWICLETPQSIVVTGLGKSTGAEDWTLY